MINVVWKKHNFICYLTEWPGYVRLRITTLQYRIVQEESIGEYPIYNIPIEVCRRNRKMEG